MNSRDKFVRVDFQRFKAYRQFTLHLRHFNILVGPNNSGKSTILAAFRILSAALRRANSRSAERVRVGNSRVLAHPVNLSGISVAGENIFHNYDDSAPATVKFTLSNGNSLTLYFPQQDTCYLLFDAGDHRAETPKEFRQSFDCSIGFVPILGPVDHYEFLLEKEAARRSLFNYAAARNFRNIWYHNPEKFELFRQTLKTTWPGMDVEPPRVELGDGKPRLSMFCPEERIPREIFWAGFGFQVWCQMLTHLIQHADASLFLIDEPDIYLHPDLQRQLLGLLRALGPDVLLATHSTEIVGEAETDELLLITKTRSRAKRIKNPSQLSEVFQFIGSNLNPVLTQIAKTRRVVFVEGKDFQILSRLAQKLGYSNIATRSSFAVVPVNGFSPDRMRNLKRGMEATLGAHILVAGILDGDYRCVDERASIVSACGEFAEFAVVLTAKEIENYLLCPDALSRAATSKARERSQRLGVRAPQLSVDPVLDEIAQRLRSYVTSQLLDNRRRFERSRGSSIDDAVIIQSALEQIECVWSDPALRLGLLPGKQVLSDLNSRLQKDHKISISTTAIVEAMTSREVPVEIVSLMDKLKRFSSERPR